MSRLERVGGRSDPGASRAAGTPKLDSKNDKTIVDEKKAQKES